MMQSKTSADRFFKITYHARSLEGNKIGAAADRHAMVYLPPGYHEEVDKRYPILFILHGYGENVDGVMIVPEREFKKRIRGSCGLFSRMS